MKTYRFTYMTMCGKTNVSVQDGISADEAKAKAVRHVESAHSPMRLVRSEMKTAYGWANL